MIYVCIPSHNEGSTVGVLLWKIRKVFSEFPREYQLLVCDDASTDNTAEVLESYTKVLPLTVYRHATQQGYPATVESLLRHAVDLTDKPKRDFLILLHADFTHDAGTIPDLVRRLESGADLVVAEATLVGAPSRAYRWVRQYSPLLFRKRVRVPRVSDVCSGYFAARLFTVRNLLQTAGGGSLLTLDGWGANAELLGRLGRIARRVETVPTTERHDLRQRDTRVHPWKTARELWRQSRELVIPEQTPAETVRPNGSRRRRKQAVSQ
ncbi:MAG: glycosyltransferase family 2 protein [Planctomycetota bacterium]|jgi:glycosyltransferase involved in cell wall biosynthesis